MLTNYFKIALRNLRAHPLYSLINVAGLALGLACCVLIFLFVRDELSYDEYHAKADRIYRVVTSTSDSGEPTNANGFFVTGPALETDFPEVQETVRFRKTGQGRQTLVRHGENAHYEDRFFFADSTVFDVFSVPMLNGDPKTALASPNSLVLTESSAQKYFGLRNPIGTQIQADPDNDGELTNFTVTGVVEDVPEQSHIHFDFLASFSSQSGYPDLPGWGSFWQVYTYVLLPEGYNPDRLEARLPEFQASHTDMEWFSLGLQPLTNIHLHSSLNSEVEPTSSIAYVWVFSVAGLFVLLLACINFMNLATARSARRSSEVGVRKALGARRQQLVKQFLGESVVLALLALVFALTLVAALLPIVNTMSGKSLSFSLVADGSVTLALVGVTVLVGVFAGSYPALYLSGFEPIEVLRKRGSSGGHRRFRQGLVVFQFAVSSLLIAATAIAYQQMDYIQNRPLGFARDQIVVLPINDAIRDRYESFKEEVTRHAGVLNASGSALVPTKGSSTYLFQLEGRNEESGLHTYLVDDDFLETYDIQIEAGRGFSEDHRSDEGRALLVNEAALQNWGIQNPQDILGKKITGAADGRVVGVIEDFHSYSLREAVRPMLVGVLSPDDFNYLGVRIGTENYQGALDRVESTWDAFAPNYPFSYFFLDDAFADMHRADQRFSQVLTFFALLTILIACLGLFGLAAYTAEKRRKEVGIRKALGATATNVVTLLSIEFVQLVGIAFLVAIPGAYYAMQQWLENFAYHTEIGVGVFLASGALVALIGLFSVSGQALRAARVDPATTLRDE